MNSEVTLSQVWDFIVAQGQPIYVLTNSQGIDTSVRVVPLGDRSFLAVDDQSGYYIDGDIDEDDLVAVDDYDDEAAIRKASDLTGILAVVGVPGGSIHDFRWFDADEEDEANDWIEKKVGLERELNPALGTIRAEILNPEDAFGAMYRDGARCYFEETIEGGFKKYRSLADFEF